MRITIKRDYRDLRRDSYPSLPDQLDTIYHHGIDVWKDEIKTIKDKYPKPEGEQ